MKRVASITSVFALFGLILLLSPSLFATATIAPFYSSNYTLIDLGPAANIPNPYGGLNIVAGNNNMLLLGGTANDVAGFSTLSRLLVASADISPALVLHHCRALQEPTMTAVWCTVRAACCFTLAIPPTRLARSNLVALRMTTSWICLRWASSLQHLPVL